MAAQYWTLVQSYLVVYVYLFPSSDTWEAVTEAQGDWWPANVCLIFSHSLSVFAWQGLHDTVCARVTCDQCPQCPAPWSHGLGSHRMCLVSVPGIRHIVIMAARPLGTLASSVLCVMTTIILTLGITSKLRRVESLNNRRKVAINLLTGVKM